MQELGCVPCWLIGIPNEPPDMQHIVEGNKRLGHDFTYASCPWHHRGIPKPGMDERAMEAAIGPSLARGRKPFHAAFGTERELLEAQNAMIERYMAVTGQTG